MGSEEAQPDKPRRDERRRLVAVTLDEASLGRGSPDGATIIAHHLSLSPFRTVIRDYEMICGSYYKAIRSASPGQIEAIDMGRRGLHNEAAELLMQRLDGKVEVDFDTARRIFTLIFALHWRG